jgi:hypothetical protein
MKMKLLTAVAVLAVALVATSMARADTISIGLYELGVNGNAITPVTSLPVPVAGLGFFSGSYGTFAEVTVTANGTPPSNEPLLDSAGIAVSASTAATLVIYVTESGLSSPTGFNTFQSDFSANYLSPGWTVSEATYISQANALWVGTPLASANFLAGGYVPSENLTPSLAPHYSETEVFTVNAVQSAQLENTSDTIQIKEVAPEPATLSLMGMGLLGLLGLRKKRVA